MSRAALLNDAVQALGSACDPDGVRTYWALLLALDTAQAAAATDTRDTAGWDLCWVALCAAIDALGPELAHQMVLDPDVPALQVVDDELRASVRALTTALMGLYADAARGGQPAARRAAWRLAATHLGAAVAELP